MNSPFKNAWSLPVVALASSLPFPPVKILSPLPGLSQLPLLHEAFTDFLLYAWPCHLLLFLTFILPCLPVFVSLLGGQLVFCVFHL